MTVEGNKNGQRKIPRTEVNLEFSALELSQSLLKLSQTAGHIKSATAFQNNTIPTSPHRRELPNAIQIYDDRAAYAHETSTDQSRLHGSHGFTSDMAFLAGMQNEIIACRLDMVDFIGPQENNSFRRFD